MVATLNFNFCLGGQGKHMRRHHGPVTFAQRAAHMRLAVAADLLVDRVPGGMVLRHWDQELGSTSVSYSGEEVQKCYAAEAVLLEPGLPPPGLAGSIQMADLLDGVTRDYIVNPQKLRRTDDHNVVPWSRPRIHATSESEKRKILVMLAKQKVCTPVSEDELWEFNGEKVGSGLFAVLKPKKAKVARPDGSFGVQQRCIINLIPPNALHRDAELGENDLLPAEGQWNAVHLLPL